MALDRVPLLNIEVDRIGFDELLRVFERGMLLPVNTDILITLQRDEDFFRIARAAEYVVVDSQILYAALRYGLGTPVPDKIAGSDFLPAFVRHHAADSSVRLFLLGGQPGAAAAAARKFNDASGRAMVVGTACPPYGFENDPAACDSIVSHINSSGATVLVAGLGAPKQEKWMAAHRLRLPGVHRFIAVGATLDMQAGLLRRAPRWMQRAGLEWLHRMAQEPGRLIRRYLGRDVAVFGLLLRQRCGRYHSPFPR